jgi:hypothetical protein
MGELVSERRVEAVALRQISDLSQSIGFVTPPLDHRSRWRFCASFPANAAIEVLNLFDGGVRWDS